MSKLNEVLEKDKLWLEGEKADLWGATGNRNKNNSD